MIQNLRSYRSLNVAAADTNATQFADRPCRLVVIRSKTGNTGTITLLGVNGGTIDSAGLVLPTGATAPTLWMDNLNQLAYKASSANDVIEILYGV